MIQLHLAGRLVRDPQSKTSARGKPYTQSLLTANTTDGEQLVSLMAFDPEVSNLLTSLKKGDSLRTTG